ncbi:MAG: amidohydrolase family protein, partial [Myxococcales bacterium]|nr:amidohydrolase family protein [Myxococcales bacterium]
LCDAGRVGRALRDHPRLRMCVPHLGADEFPAYADLLRRHDNLWLDTTMVLADYLPGEVPWDLVRARPERILYGTDFPNLPYAWDRELRALAGAGLPDAALEAILGGNARALFGIDRGPAVTDAP